MIPRPLTASGPTNAPYANAAYPNQPGINNGNAAYGYTQYGAPPRPSMAVVSGTGGHNSGMARPPNAVAGMMSAPASLVANVAVPNKDPNAQARLDGKANATKPLEAINLPSWSSEEIDKRLTESENFLREWKDLIDRSVKTKPSDLPAGDLAKHVTLKRKLHENLGVLTRIVQKQISQKKAKMSNEQAGTNSIPSQPQQSNQHQALSNAMQTSNSLALTAPYYNNIRPQTSAPQPVNGYYPQGGPNSNQPINGQYSHPQQQQQQPNSIPPLSMGYQQMPPNYNYMKQQGPNGTNIPNSAPYPPANAPRGMPMYYVDPQQMNQTNQNGQPVQMSMPRGAVAGYQANPNQMNPNAVKPGTYNPPSIPQGGNYVYQGNAGTQPSMQNMPNQQQMPPQNVNGMNGSAQPFYPNMQQQQPQQQGNYSMQGSNNNGYAQSQSNSTYVNGSMNPAAYRYPPNSNPHAKPGVMISSYSNPPQNAGKPNAVPNAQYPNQHAQGGNYVYPPANYNYGNNIPYTVGPEGKPVYASNNNNVVGQTTGARPVANAPQQNPTGNNMNYTTYSNAPTATYNTSNRPNGAPPVSPYMVNIQQPQQQPSAPSQSNGPPASIYMQPNTPLPSQMMAMNQGNKNLPNPTN